MRRVADDTARVKRLDLEGIEKLKLRPERGVDIVEAATEAFGCEANGASLWSLGFDPPRAKSASVDSER